MAPFMMLVSRTSTAPDVTHAGHSVASPAPAAAVEAALRGFAGPRWPSAARSIIFEALVKVKLPPVPTTIARFRREFTSPSSRPWTPVALHEYARTHIYIRHTGSKQICCRLPSPRLTYEPSASRAHHAQTHLYHKPGGSGYNLHSKCSKFSMCRCNFVEAKLTCN